MSQILFFVPHPVEDAGYRYRIRQFVPFLEAAGHQCTIWPFSTSTLYAALRRPGNFREKIPHTLYCTCRRVAQLAKLSRFDLIFIQREVFPFLTPIMESWVLFRHPRVVFALDDAIYAGQPHATALNHPVLYKLKYGHGVETVMRRSIHVVAGNRILAEYARNFNSQVSVLPTVVDCDQYKYQVSREKEVVTIGWVGSRSTLAYLRAIEPALKRLEEANRGKIQFRFVGVPEYRPSLSNCDIRPFRLEREFDDLAGIDIGLMPLPDTTWTRGKCAFKAIQYMATGAVTVASPVGVAADLVQHDVNGLLASTNEEWFTSLNDLVRDAAKRQRLSAAGRQTVEWSYSLQTWGPKFTQLISKLLPPKASSEWTKQSSPIFKREESSGM